MTHTTSLTVGIIFLPNSTNFALNAPTVRDMHITVNDVRMLQTALSCPYAPTELLVAVYTAAIAATNMQVCAQVLACSAAEI